MATIYYDSDADFDLLKTRTIAVIGYGSQGHAQVLNLQDSGANVIVGLRPTSRSISEAESNGLTVKSVEDAAAEGDIIQILIPDELQGTVYTNQIEPNLEDGNMIMFSHGFSIHFGQISPSKNIDVAMIAPKAPGHLVRRVFTEGAGTPCLLAIHQDVTGQAKDLALAYAKGIGGARAGVIETTFRAPPKATVPSWDQPAAGTGALRGGRRRCVVRHAGFHEGVRYSRELGLF